jgi:aryl carrier-like protein
LLWSATRNIENSDFAEQLYDLPTAGLDSVKILTWIAEPGSDLDVDRIDFRMQTPDVSFDQWVFLTSYAKALTCWSASTGLVRDRAHIDDGSFDSISSTGLFCLATAAAAGEGIVSHDFATAVITKAYQAVSTLRGPYQLLPHFVRLDDKGTLQRHKGTEYSTIDTSIFYLSMMLGCRMLGQDDLLAQLVQDVRMIRFAPLISDEGYLSHGVMEDEKTIIPYQWKDWGGETALVLVMMRIADPQSMAMMDKTGHVYQGTGFIVEIQSLLLPDFDNEALDAVSGVNWRKARATMLQSQRENAYADARRRDRQSAHKPSTDAAIFCEDAR